MVSFLGVEGVSWLKPAPGTSVHAERAVLLLLGLVFCAGGEGQGKPVLHISSYCFFTYEVREWMAWENLSV